MKAKRKQYKQKKQAVSQWDIFWEPWSTPLSKLSKRLNNRKYTRKNTIIIFVIATLLPIIGWGLGAIANPDGWMSMSPLFSYVLVAEIVYEYWRPIVAIVICLILLGLLLKIRPSVYARMWSYALFIASFIISLVVYTITESASESEFTG